MQARRLTRNYTRFRYQARTRLAELHTVSPQTEILALFRSVYYFFEILERNRV